MELKNKWLNSYFSWKGLGLSNVKLPDYVGMLHDFTQKQFLHRWVRCLQDCEIQVIKMLIVWGF
jgi:hypothetical protein